MTLHIVRLGTPRLPQEGPRIGAVRRPPRGVRKERYAADDWFDVWYPDLAPSLVLMSRGRAASTAKEWSAFVRAFRTEMSAPTASRTLDLLALLSREFAFLDRLLLRGRIPLPSLRPARTAGRARRESRLEVFRFYWMQHFPLPQAHFARRGRGSGRGAATCSEAARHSIAPVATGAERAAAPLLGRQERRPLPSPPKRRGRGCERPSNLRDSIWIWKTLVIRKRNRSDTPAAHVAWRPASTTCLITVRCRSSHRRGHLPLATRPPIAGR